MTTMHRVARETIKFWYFGDDVRIRTTIAGFVRWCGYVDGRWGGDACGCSDDRCIGFHHDEHEECSCLPALLDQWVLEQRAGLGPVVVAAS